MSHSPHDTTSNGSDDLNTIMTHDRGLSEIGTMRSGSINRRQSNLNEVEIERINTYRLQHRSTVGSISAKVTPRDQWLPLGAGKPHPPALPDPEEYIVEFNDANDPMHPQNWPFRRKLGISATLSYTTFVSSFSSAIYSSAVGHIGAHFHISTEVAILGVTLYVLGFASGPTVWAPASELIGRRWPICIGMFGFSLFTIATATCKDVQTLMLTRFFAGFFSASPIAIVPAVFADIWNNQTRGVAVAMFAMAVFVGPFASPFIGGFITMSYLGWRWTMYIASIMGWLATGLCLLFLKETYAPAVLVEKAAILRRQTHNWGIRARQEEIELDWGELITNNFSRPFRMLFTEPIVLLISLWMSFVYGIMYALLGAYPVVFQGIHGLNLGVGSLPFIGLIIGEFLAGAYILFDQRSYTKKLAANNNVPIPEWRLPPAILGGVCFCVGLFWYGWTGWTKSIHWMAPTASGVVTGFGIYVIFLQCFNYLIDSYLMFAASVFASNTILRSAVGAAFPLFSKQMFVNLGVQWAGTLLGCLALIMIPIPLVFIKWGPALRKKSKFAPILNPAPATKSEKGLTESV
ncbi:Major facilitator superfamily domain general substrate transporter [Penicillium concentricum]|uniref:Major facilitator superfamily domain general substrate transporter n=1 Tax=Penicillium concentricum TaxID=293559 RepID=A0A9W9R9D2_9EURO|nr:Major facilitator superfamily domain general substrate transporter [Penicillium concentricum]KAJ5355938.1 Major facilitator superfamily domain general substrate transporter [Penicillium concentricum]